jgi:hypothetical protein
MTNKFETIKRTTNEIREADTIDTLDHNTSIISLQLKLINELCFLGVTCSYLSKTQSTH